jgi:hypothetical protein
MLSGRQGNARRGAPSALWRRAALHWDGLTLSVVDSGNQLRLNGIWGSGASDVWTLGNAGTILHYQGAFFTSITRAYVTSILRAVWGTDADDIWAVGDGGSILRNWGGHWVQHIASGNLRGDMYGIAGRGTNDVWMAGSGGTVLQWNGTNLVPRSGPLLTGAIQDDLTAVVTVGSGSNDIIAAGSNSTVARYDGSGTTWSRLISAGTIQFNASWGTDLSGLWVVGDGGAILRWQGTGLVADPQSGLVTTSNLRAIWGAAQNDIWAVGEGGTILHYNGLSWSVVTISQTVHLNGIWGSSASDIWAVGNRGTILRYDGQQWIPYESVVSHDLHAVWGSSSTNVLFVGASGLILRYSPES